jgi:hypothetical protein
VRRTCAGVYDAPLIARAIAHRPPHGGRHPAEQATWMARYANPRETRIWRGR